MRLLLFIVSCVLASLAQGEEIVTLEPRAGATQSYLLITPKDAPPSALAVLFPGGPGSIRLRNEGGRIRFSPNNFLVRSRDAFTAAGVTVAILDAPSDQSSGMHNSFRKSEPHAEDVRAVVADLRKRFAGAPAFLVGTSMGTVSAAHAGRALGSGVAGVVLTSSPFRPSGPRSKHGDS